MARARREAHEENVKTLRDLLTPAVEAAGAFVVIGDLGGGKTTFVKQLLT